MHPARKALAIVFLFLAVSGSAFFAYLAVTGGPELVDATRLPEPRPLPEFQLVDHHGAPITRDRFVGGWQLVFFGFTNCPDICPATLQQLSIAKQRVEANGGEFPEIVLVSVDPDRDRPDNLAAYVANFGDGVSGITGDLAELTALTKPLGIYFEKTGDPAGNYTVDHSSVVLLINSQAEWQALFSAPHNVDTFVHDVPILTGG
jgi:protein SCO1/2